MEQICIRAIIEAFLFGWCPFSLNIITEKIEDMYFLFNCKIQYKLGMAAKYRKRCLNMKNLSEKDKDW